MEFRCISCNGINPELYGSTKLTCCVVPKLYVPIWERTGSGDLVQAVFGVFRGRGFGIDRE